MVVELLKALGWVVIIFGVLSIPFFKFHYYDPIKVRNKIKKMKEDDKRD